MKLNLNTNIKHITRVEGHGDISIQIEDGKLKKARWMVVETPRFFESMLVGKTIDMAPILTSRICGICSIGHALASIRAIENALQFEPPPLAQKLRLIAKHAETIQSHILHLFFLVAPDFYQEESVIPILSRDPETVKLALFFKKLANDICDLVAGRTTHPVTLQSGGISKIPSNRNIDEMIFRLDEGKNKLNQLVDTFYSLQMPEFVRETEFVSLKGDSSRLDAYPWIGGNLISSDGIEKEEKDYLEMTNEYIVDFSTSKFARLSRDSFAAGSLARLNNNYSLLLPKAKEASEKFGLSPVNHNPFMNNVAQLIETVHVYYEMLELFHDLASQKNIHRDDYFQEIKINSGEGISAIEVPRGILYHHYVIDNKGIIQKANCVIPTTQNNANIHYDLNQYVEEMVDRGYSESEIIHRCEMLVRAYDPCISCSVH